MVSLFCNPICSICSSTCLLYVICGRPLSVSPTTLKSNALNILRLCLLKTCLFVHSISLHSLRVVYLRFLANPEVFFNLIPHVALTAFSVLRKIAHAMFPQTPCLASLQHNQSYSTIFNESFLPSSNSPHSRNFIHPIYVLAVAAALLPPLIFNLFPSNKISSHILLLPQHFFHKKAFCQS